MPYAHSSLNKPWNWSTRCPKKTADRTFIWSRFLWLHLTWTTLSQASLISIEWELTDRRHEFLWPTSRHCAASRGCWSRHKWEIYRSSYTAPNDWLPARRLRSYHESLALARASRTSWSLGTRLVLLVRSCSKSHCEGSSEWELTFLLPYLLLARFWSLLDHLQRLLSFPLPDRTWIQ